LARLRALPPEAFAGEVEAGCIVHQPIEDRIGVGWITDQLMPAIDWQLAGDNGGAAAVAIIEDFEKVTTGGGVERLEPPIVEDEKIDTAKSAQRAQVASIAPGKRVMRLSLSSLLAGVAPGHIRLHFDRTLLRPPCS